MRPTRPLLILASLVALAAPASAKTWLGASATTQGYGVHLGTSLLSIPFIGTLGLEGAAELPWNAAQPNRYAVGATLRDLNLPLTKVDAFATVGAEYMNTWAYYGEAGLRGPLLGPAGWRLFARGSTSGQFGAGLGLELRF